MKSFTKSLYATILFAVICTSCGEKSPQNGVVEGVVMDATMNNVSVISANGDTVNISTMDADPVKVPGVMLEDSVKVFYSIANLDGVEVFKADSLVVTAHSPYYFISGSWTQEIAGQEGQKQGFVLNQNGTAASINMATLEINNWNMPNSKEIVFNTKSIGNKQTIEAQSSYKIVKLNADSLVLEQDGNIFWKLSRNK